MTDLLRFSLADRVAVVTGGGSGIGKGIAIGFARAGAHVVLAEADGSSGEIAAKQIRELGRKSLPVQANVLNSGQVEKMVEITMAEFGRIDILVNNVGGTLGLTAPVVQMDEDMWDAIITLNLKGTFICSKVIGKIMIDQRHGNIINIASGSGRRPYPGNAPYAASKAAILNFTETLAVELARYQIRVNAIVPGIIATPMGAYRGTPKERAERAGIPLERAGEPEDIAMAAVYLASDAADFVTGVSLDVRGGPIVGKGDMELFASKFPDRYRSL